MSQSPKPWCENPNVFFFQLLWVFGCWNPYWWTRWCFWRSWKSNCGCHGENVKSCLSVRLIKLGRSEALKTVAGLQRRGSDGEITTWSHYVVCKTRSLWQRETVVLFGSVMSFSCLFGMAGHSLVPCVDRFSINTLENKLWEKNLLFSPKFSSVK